jgi:hypothetical protein
MKVTLHCRTAPGLTRWVTVLVDKGWKIIDHEADRIAAKRQLGQSEYPLKNATIWHLTIEDLNTEEFAAEVTIEVPAFANSPFSRSRINEEFDDIATIVGDVELQEETSLDLLSELRNQ